MDLLPVLKRFGQQRVLVIGDLILDCFIWGKVTRISPEAPVPVVDVQSNTFALGGGANVANNIVALGGQATVLGVVGSDWAAGTMEEIFKDKGIDFVAVEGRRPTTVKTRVIAHSQQVVRFDQEPEHDAVLISDYSKGVVTGEVVRSVIRASKGKKFIAVDPKVGHFHLYKGISLVTPNLMEASQGAGVEITDEKTLIRAGSRLLKKLGCKAVLLTRGEEGMSLFQDGSVIHIPTLARKVFDVTGAGDTVIAAFALAHAARASMEEAAVISNHAAGIVVGEVGTATATQARIRQSIRQSKLKIEKQAIGG
jgi:D-beta-D-heptose 7-phosphate kinase/D-beta-D-heptose 1-phosphate adenosyltransferase